MSNTQQQRILAEMDIPLWLERKPVVVKAYPVNTANPEVDTTAKQGFGINLSGSAVSGFMWFTENANMTAADKNLLSKIKAAVAGEADGLLASPQPDSSVDFAATIKDQLITRVVVFGSAEFLAQIKSAASGLSVELISAPSLTLLADSSQLKRKLWEQLKAVSVNQ